MDSLFHVAWNRISNKSMLQCVSTNEAISKVSHTAIKGNFTLLTRNDGIVPWTRGVIAWRADICNIFKGKRDLIALPDMGDRIARHLAGCDTTHCVLATNTQLFLKREGERLSRALYAAFFAMLVTWYLHLFRMPNVLLVIFKLFANRHHHKRKRNASRGLK